jgi:L-iditol 2-dehydrogenase
MKALVLEQYRQFTYKDVPEPQIGPDEVLIRVGACGICGSDIHGMDGRSGRRIPPIIMGHEAAGVIEAVGSDCTGAGGEWQTGQRVTFDSTIYCGHCYYCRNGQINLCDNRRVMGVSTEAYRQDGAFAEFVAVPKHILYHLPDELSFERAAMVEALSIAYHAVARTPLPLDATAVVAGTGMIGLLVVQVLRHAGCRRVIAVDLDQERLDAAVRLGATLGLRSDRDDVIGTVRNLTEGRGADAAFEVAGLTPTIQLATNVVRKGGTVTMVGNLSPMVELPLQSIVTRELTLIASCASRLEYPQCLDLLARGVVNVDAMISQVAPLAEGAAWFDRLYNREPGLMKVILVP